MGVKHIPRYWIRKARALKYHSPIKYMVTGSVSPVIPEDFEVYKSSPSTCRQIRACKWKVQFWEKTVDRPTGKVIRDWEWGGTSYHKTYKKAKNALKSYLRYRSIRCLVVPSTLIK